MTARRLPLGSHEGLFRALHKRFLSDGHAPVPWHRFDPSPLSDVSRESHRRAWAARAESEYRSMVVFGEILARLPEAGIALEVSTALTRLIHDEARHTELCAAMAERLGGVGDVTLDPAHLRLVGDDLPARLFVARWTVSMFCVGESASVGLLGALADGAREPCTRAVTEILLRDERLHDRFGWALARTVLPSLSDDERAWLAADLSHTFAHYELVDAAGILRGDDGALPAAPEAPPEASEGFGIIALDLFARAFYQRLDDVILPSLAALGVPAREAWARRRETGRYPT